VSISYPVDEVDGSGSGTLAYDASSTMKFTRGSLTAPFRAAINLEVKVVDADGISAPDPLSFNDIPFTGEASGMNSDEMRWGRMVMKNAYGSELLPLAMPLRAEYYNGSSFEINEDDYCTSLSVTQLTLTGIVTSTATLHNLSSSPLAAGDAKLVFSAPSATGYIDVQLDLSSMPWLQFDWDGDSNYDNNPAARASFGLFEGNPGMIYMRESFR
jgi:MSHA biogenesis protein MshQ